MQAPSLQNESFFPFLLKKIKQDGYLDIPLRRKIQKQILFLSHHGAY